MDIGMEIEIIRQEITNKIKIKEKELMKKMKDLDEDLNDATCHFLDYIFDPFRCFTNLITGNFAPKVRSEIARVKRVFKKQLDPY